jgi:hypothetical protein
MASRASSRFIANDPLPIHIGDKVARFFPSHELQAGRRDQWIQGKVAATKLILKKGTRNQQQPWWTLTFDLPCNKLLCCNSEEVHEMKEQYNILRLKISALQQQVGCQIVVQWTDGDRDISLSDWAGDFRICEVPRYLAAQNSYVLRFKCGYEKIVDAVLLIELVESSGELMASKKMKTKKCVAEAKQEWEQNLATMSTVLKVAEQSETVASVEVSTPAAKFAETEARLLREQQELQQRANVLRQQQKEAIAAAEQEKLRKEEEAATAAQEKIAQGRRRSHSREGKIAEGGR